MDEQQAVEIVYEALAGKNSIPVVLSRGDALDRDLVARTEQAIRFLIERYRGRSDVPKCLAAAFVDLQTSMQWGRELHSEKEQEEIEDSANELVQLGFELFGEE